MLCAPHLAWTSAVTATNQAVISLPSVVGSVMPIVSTFPHAEWAPNPLRFSLSSPLSFLTSLSALRSRLRSFLSSCCFSLSGVSPLGFRLRSGLGSGSGGFSMPRNRPNRDGLWRRGWSCTSILPIPSGTAIPVRGDHLGHCGSGLGDRDGERWCFRAFSKAWSPQVRTTGETACRTPFASSRFLAFFGEGDLTSSADIGWGICLPSFTRSSISCNFLCNFSLMCMACSSCTKSHLPCRRCKNFSCSRTTRAGAWLGLGLRGGL
mmetsp:Transcript_59699/g.106497  ORF Transcript_59699/g.106497 Transcript_59699/m.106497 type:complete len:264 (-) Transcript_59699:770-1561(-)